MEGYLIQLIMRNSGGSVTDESTARQILLTISVILFLIALYVVFGGVSNRTPPEQVGAQSHLNASKQQQITPTRTR